MSFFRVVKWATVFFSVLFGTAFAQSNQNASGNGVNIGGNNKGFVNTGDMNIIFQSEAALTDDPKAKQIIERLSKVLSDLVGKGEASFSEKAIRVLARDAVEQLANQPLTRNVIQQRQFTVPYQQTYNIAGTNNRITYTRSNCGANMGITFRFNRDKHCWFGVGGTLEFTSGGSRYELVFDGYDDSRRAKFTIYPVN